jgi:hypothetical protein
LTDLAAPQSARERKLVSLAGRGFHFGEHSIDCDRCEARIPYRVIDGVVEADYKLYGDVILCRLCDAESHGATKADAARATFIIEREGGETRQIPEPTFYPPGTPIDLLLEAPIHGNAYSDGPLNIALLKYALDGNNDVAKRRTAIAKLDEIVGEPRPSGTDRHVVETFMMQMEDYAEEIMASTGDQKNEFFEQPDRTS